jgi:nucleoside 2-deoxyribosyltransferase
MIISTRPQCVLLLPPSGENNPILQAIDLTLKECDVEPVIPSSNGPNRESAGGSIRYADMIIADVTGADPNVMFDLGLAFAGRKPIMPILNRSERRVPSALAGNLFLVYDPSQPERFHFQSFLRHWVTQNVEAWRGVRSA